MKSHYQILEVSSSADTAEIRSAYLRLAREYHPDRVPEHLTRLRADAEEKLKQVNEAWAVLSDPAKRRKYDLRSAERSAYPSPAGQPKPPVSTFDAALSVFRQKQELVKLLLLIILVTTAFVLIGRFFVSRATATWQIGGAVPTSNPADTKTGVHQYNGKPLHIRTSRFADSGGLDVQLLTLAQRPTEVEITFGLRAGSHNDFLLYEPPGSRYKTVSVLGREVTPDRNLEELYLLDNKGKKFYSTTGFIGGEQVAFDVYNFTRRINFGPGQELALSAKFPPLTTSSTSLTFCSPALGNWQAQWCWPAIDLQ